MPGRLYSCRDKADIETRCSPLVPGKAGTSYYFKYHPAAIPCKSMIQGVSQVKLFKHLIKAGGSCVKQGFNIVFLKYCKTLKPLSL